MSNRYAPGLPFNVQCEEVPNQDRGCNDFKLTITDNNYGLSTRDCLRLIVSSQMYGEIIETFMDRKNTTN